ncbi:MAG: NAD(P)-dependent oxidoreductase [Blastomonas sp.]
MKIAVTGSRGKVGRAAVAALRKAGHRVIGLDLAADPADAFSVAVDCSDFGQTMGALSGVDAVGSTPDAVLHLAGIPRPGPAPDHIIFSNNLAASYNIFSACARLGISKVVWASSETILGLPFSAPPAFAPLDESHPDRPNWSYALSKHLGEAAADQFVRWHPELSIVSLRFSNVYGDEDYDQIAAIQTRPESRKFNLWGYVDAEDCATACRLAIEAELTGHHRLIIAAADNIAGQPSLDLMERYFPGVPLDPGLDGEQSLLSSQQAEATIGYTPQFSWRDRVNR